VSDAPEKLWEPPAELVKNSRLREFMRWLAAERGRCFATYDELWQWSVDDLEAFWSAIWHFFGVQADGEYERALGSREMPGAEWFVGTSLNYAEHVFAGKDEAETAILHASELRQLEELSWGELRAQVAATAAGLRALGVERGDRVVAYMPNIPDRAEGALRGRRLPLRRQGLRPTRNRRQAASGDPEPAAYRPPALPRP
jgi:acetoacetyl-CoA synthetase